MQQELDPRSNDPDRSQIFTERSTLVPTSYPFELLNKEKALLTPEQYAQAEQVLRSGAVTIVIPSYREMQYGNIQQVIAYASERVGANNVLVLDAADDGSYEYARSVGATGTIQPELETVLDLERMARDFGLQFPLRAGKGRTVMTGLLYQRLFQAEKLARTKFNVMMDADITNPYDFDHASYLAWAMTQYPPEMLFEVRSAQHDRDNQDIMNTITASQILSPRMRDYVLSMVKTVWLLTGQYARDPAMMMNAPSNVGYATEVIANMASHDYASSTGRKRVQIEVPVRCQDGRNTVEKDNMMMTGIGSTIFALNMAVFSRGLRLEEMRPADYRVVNALLQQAGVQIVSTIEKEEGENKEAAVLPDSIMPPVSYLLDNGYVDFDAVRRLAAKREGRRWNGVNLPRYPSDPEEDLPFHE